MDAHDIPREAAKEIYSGLLHDDIWMNDKYQVNITHKSPHHAFGDVDITHLSIKRRDKEIIHDWRDLQEIKNMLVGPEHEAIELYPAESRRVDSANQYHLWVFPEGESIPVGWVTRFVQGEDKAEKAGGKQRPLDEDTLSYNDRLALDKGLRP